MDMAMDADPSMIAEDSRNQAAQDLAEKQLSVNNKKGSSDNTQEEHAKSDTKDIKTPSNNKINISDYNIEKVELDDALSALDNAEILAEHYQVPNIIIKSLFDLNFNVKRPYYNKYGNENMKSDIEDDDVSRFLLNLESQIIEFVLKSEQDSMKLNPMNSYYRLLSHQLADYYHLGHILSNDGTSMVLYKINTSLINADDETKKHAKFDQSGNIKPLDFKNLKFDPKEKLNRIKLSEIYENYSTFFKQYKTSLANEFQNLHLNTHPMISYPDRFYPNANISQRPMGIISHGFHSKRDDDDQVKYVEDEDDDEDEDAEVIVSGDNSEKSSNFVNSTKHRYDRRGKNYTRRGYNNQYYYQPFGYYGIPRGSNMTPQPPVYPGGVVPMVPISSPQMGSAAMSSPYYYYPVIHASSAEEFKDGEEGENNSEKGNNRSPATQPPGSPTVPHNANPAGYVPIPPSLPVQGVPGMPPMMPNEPSGVSPRGMCTYQYYQIPGPPGSAPIPMIYYENNGGYYNRGGKKYNRRGRNVRHYDRSVETS